MKMLITGSASGIGHAVAEKFLTLGHEVIGFDLLPASIAHPLYTHHTIDISKKRQLPPLEDVELIFNNAGKQNDHDIANNLVGSINVTEKYAFQPAIKAVLFNASASAHSGFEFPEYVASKAGLIGYMKNCAVRLAPLGAICNSISLGGVLTASNAPVIDNPRYWQQIMDATPLKKWATVTEVVEWVVFLLLTNKSATGIDVLIDNGEYNLNSTFVWPKK